MPLFERKIKHQSEYAIAIVVRRKLFGAIDLAGWPRFGWVGLVWHAFVRVLHTCNYWGKVEAIKDCTAWQVKRGQVQRFQKAARQTRLEII